MTVSGREVVITGLGMLTPLGKNVGENWLNVKSARTGITHEPREGLPEYFQYIGKVPEYKLPDDIPPKQMGQMKFLNRGAILGFCAACEAVAGSVDGIAHVDPGRRGLYVASGDHTNIGGESMYPAVKDATGNAWESIDYPKLNESALNKINPFMMLEPLNNNLFSFLSAHIEFMGPSTSIASLSPYGGSALELACRCIKQDKADVALAVGYGNWITELAMFELEGLGILSKCRHGSRSFRPFDVNRDGFIPGEGGAAILLESAETAERNGSAVLGKIKGTANCIEFASGQKFSVAEKVSERSIRSVLKETSCRMDDMSFIIAHGSGTRKGDRSEMRSLEDVFSSHDSDAPLCALKPYTGHMGAASDIAEVIIGLNALKEKTVPATLNFQAAEKRFSDIRISASAQTCDKNKFLSVSYGVGGQSSTIIVEG